MPTCKLHPATKLICPRCNAKKGGDARAMNQSPDQIAAWGKMGGRPKKTTTGGTQNDTHSL